MSFNSNDPKYQTCCCGAHVTTLARVMISLSLAGHLFTAFKSAAQDRFIDFISIPVYSLGAVAVFKEVRTPLLVFIVIGIVHDIVKSMEVPFNAYNNPEKKEIQALIIPMGILIYLIFSPVMIFVYSIYWRLAKFIEDRDIAHQVPVRYENV